MRFTFGRTFGVGTLLASASVIQASAAVAQDAQPMPAAGHRTPLEMVQALQETFGKHHARAVHTKGVILVGQFTPTAAAATLTRNPAFKAGRSLPLTARFSDFAGLPELPDNDDNASPAGFAFKIDTDQADADDIDVEANQHPDFITANFDDFAVFLHAVATANKGDKTLLQEFLASHPHAKEFLGSRTYPASFAQATYFGLNSMKFTNAAGRSRFVRYRFVPRTPEKYLSPEQRKSMSANYLVDEIAERVRTQPIIFDWYAQIAERGDKIGDPSIAWPNSRKLVKLGTITLTGSPSNLAAVNNSLVFLVGQSHPGIDPADPMLVMRNGADSISLGERQ